MRVDIACLLRAAMKAILAAVLAVVAIPLFMSPSTATAEPTADEYFLMELKERGIPRPISDADAIQVAHNVVGMLIENPTMDGVATVGNGLIEASTERGAPMNKAQAGTYIRLAVHYFGPPWLGQTLDEQSRAP